MASRGRRRDASDRYDLVSAVRLLLHLSLPLSVTLDLHARPHKSFAPHGCLSIDFFCLVPSPPSVSSAVWTSSFLPHRVRGKLGILLKGAKMMLCLFILGARKAKKCTYIYIYSIYKAVYFVISFFVFFSGPHSLSPCVFVRLCLLFYLQKKRGKRPVNLYGVFLFVCFGFVCLFVFGACRNRGAATSAWCQSSHLACEHTLPHVGKRTPIQNELKNKLINKINKILKNTYIWKSLNPSEPSSTQE